jgi:hypothetical protein
MDYTYAKHKHVGAFECIIGSTTNPSLKCIYIGDFKSEEEDIIDGTGLMINKNFISILNIRDGLIIQINEFASQNKYYVRLLMMLSAFSSVFKCLHPNKSDKRKYNIYDKISNDILLSVLSKQGIDFTRRDFNNLNDRIITGTMSDDPDIEDEYNTPGEKPPSHEDDTDDEFDINELMSRDQSYDSSSDEEVGNNDTGGATMSLKSDELYSNDDFGISETSSVKTMGSWASSSEEEYPDYDSASDTEEMMVINPYIKSMKAGKDKIELARATISSDVNINRIIKTISEMRRYSSDTESVNHDHITLNFNYMGDEIIYIQESALNLTSLTTIYVYKSSIESSPIYIGECKRNDNGSCMVHGLGLIIDPINGIYAIKSSNNIVTKRMLIKELNISEFERLEYNLQEIISCINCKYEGEIGHLRLILSKIQGTKSINYQRMIQHFIHSKMRDMEFGSIDKYELRFMIASLFIMNGEVPDKYKKSKLFVEKSVKIIQLVLSQLDAGSKQTILTRRETSNYMSMGNKLRLKHNSKKMRL